MFGCEYQILHFLMQPCFDEIQCSFANKKCFTSLRHLSEQGEYA